MRLSNKEINTLKNSIYRIRPNSKVYLFGSRIDDSKRGGDIDILIIDKEKLTFSEKGEIRREFFSNFGPQKLDLVSFTNDSTETFKELILKDAIPL